MEQLHLLSQIIPAFGALGQDFNPNGDEKGARDALDYNSDIAVIGKALAASNGKRAPGLIEEELDRLLRALESRLPKRSKFSTFLKHGNSDAFARVRDLAKRIEKHDLGGFSVCSQLLRQSETDRATFLSIMRQDKHFDLFHKGEITSQEKRGKFLARIKSASEHLCKVYCDNETSSAEMSLSQHPSSGKKEMANRVYRMLRRHWKCKCGHIPREARLSLASELPRHGVATKQRHDQAKYEVLLPMCKRHDEWRVANVEVGNQIRPHGEQTCSGEWQCVTEDVCMYLASSTGFQVNLRLQSDGLWHRRPMPSDDADHHTAMESLHELLGDGIKAPDIMRYSSKERVMLCYTLANSMLFLYPGSWLNSVWNSSKVYFIRRAAGSISTTLPFVLTLPYLSSDVQDVQEICGTDVPHFQSHTHPNILALGIILLEIVTGATFPIAAPNEAISDWEEWNAIVLKAWDLMRRTESMQGKDTHIGTQIRSTLCRVIRACLRLDPPPNFPTNSLKEEESIRQYILSCIIAPLESCLVNGYIISPEELHNSLEKDLQTIGHVGAPSTTIRSQQTPHVSALALDSGMAGGESVHKPNWSQSSGYLTVGPSTGSILKEICLLADNDQGEVAVDTRKIKDTEKWFDYHNGALGIIEGLRGAPPANYEDGKIKIAILDSGIDLSEDHKSLRKNSGIHYRDWVDGETDWKDNDGHGTHLAFLLQAVAPNAVIHVARVFNRKPKARRSARIVADAIRHAVEDWGVDIIVMSFGLGGFDSDVHEMIQLAARNGVLMFAAASNGGKNDGIAWPAKAENVICIHSADGKGNPSSFTPGPRDNMRIMVLGEHISSAWPPGLGAPDNLKLMSGTSCAAPIAAGIAAIILDYARTFLTEAEWKMLRRADCMRRLFESLSELDGEFGDSRYRWARHWEWFGRGEGWIQGEIRRHLR